MNRMDTIIPSPTSTFLRKLLYLSPAIWLILLLPGWIYTIFVLFALVWILELRIPHISARWVPIGLFATLLFFGLLIEASAWGDDYVAGVWSTSLHPQLLYGLLAGVGLYGAWALAWTIALSCYHYTVSEVFWLAGAIGIAVEQQGAVFLAGITNMPMGLLLWAISALVYGASVARPYTLWQTHLQGSSSRLRWVIPVLLVLIIGSLVGWAWDVAIPLPDHKPILTAPLW